MGFQTSLLTSLRQESTYIGDAQLQLIYLLSSFNILLLGFSLYRWYQKLQSTDIYMKNPIYMRIYQKSTDISLSLVKDILFSIFICNFQISIIFFILFLLVQLLVLVFLTQVILLEKVVIKYDVKISRDLNCYQEYLRQNSQKY